MAAFNVLRPAATCGGAGVVPRPTPTRATGSLLGRFGAGALGHEPELKGAVEGHHEEAARQKRIECVP